MKSKFTAGENITIKVPPHQFEDTVRFYRDILRLTPIESASPAQNESVTFRFGDKNLWIDKCSSMSQAETWFEIKTDAIEAAQDYLNRHQVTRADDVETLPEGFKGFWVSSPANIIHLIHESD